MNYLFKSSLFAPRALSLRWWCRLEQIGVDKNWFENKIYNFKWVDCIEMRIILCVCESFNLNPSSNDESNDDSYFRIISFPKKITLLDRGVFMQLCALYESHFIDRWYTLNFVLLHHRIVCSIKYNPSIWSNHLDCDAFFYPNIYWSYID